MSARNVGKGKEFERWLTNWYGKEFGLASREGHQVVVTESGQEVQSGVDVRGPFWAAQAKKGNSFWPKAVKNALDKATRDCGRHIPAVMAAPDGDNIGHIVVLRGIDFKRIQEILIENDLSDQLLIGGNFGS